MSLELVHSAPVLKPPLGSPVNTRRVTTGAQNGSRGRLALGSIHQITIVSSGPLIANDAGTLVRPVLEPEVRMALSKAKSVDALESPRSKNTQGGMAAAAALLVVAGLTAPLLGWNAGILVPLGLTGWAAVGFSLSKDSAKK